MLLKILTISISSINTPPLLLEVFPAVQNTKIKLENRIAVSN